MSMFGSNVRIFRPTGSYVVFAYLAVPGNPAESVAAPFQDVFEQCFDPRGQ